MVQQTSFCVSKEFKAGAWNICIFIFIVALFSVQEVEATEMSTGIWVEKKGSVHIKWNIIHP